MDLVQNNDTEGLIDHFRQYGMDDAIIMANLPALISEELDDLMPPEIKLSQM